MDTILTNCKNCGSSLSGRYCSHCGEKTYTDHDKSVIHFFEEGLHFVTHFEGTLFTTIRTMFSAPGKLSLDYCQGIRKRYFKPLSLFLLLVVLYLLFPFFEGLNMKLYYHTQHRLYGPYALEKVESLMRQKHLTEAQLSEIFHQKSEKVSKFMLLVILPVTALFCWIFTFRKRRLFFDQMVFSTEISSFFLFWSFLMLPLLTSLFALAYHAAVHHYPLLTDDYIGTVSYSVFAVYIAIACRRFYNMKWGLSILFTLIFLAGYYIIVNWLYKFLLFAAVINQIH